MPTEGPPLSLEPLPPDSTLADDAGMTTERETGVDLYWLPLGAGGHSVRLNGRVFEAVAAREGRPPCDLYHSALEVRVPEGRFVIEQTPVPDGNGGERGVVAQGAVGSRWAGRFRIFRYEVRRWGDGRRAGARAQVGASGRVLSSLKLLGGDG